MSFFDRSYCWGRKEVKEGFVRGESGVRGYEQVWVDILNESKWERWKRGVSRASRKPLAFCSPILFLKALLQPTPLLAMVSGS